MHFRTLAIALFCLCVDQFALSQRETMFLDVDAYQPVPSPDGKLIAYVLTGMKMDGTTGFGRSHLRSQVEFVDQNRTHVQNSNVEGFLGEWLADSSGICSYRDWRFGLVTPRGEQKSGSIPQLDHPNSPQGAERAQYIPAFGGFVWIEHSGQITYLKTMNGSMASFDGLLPSEALIMPSPDGRYLAIGGKTPYEWEDRNFWIYDIEKRTWKDLGPLSIHPDPNWDYIKPNWNPWFADSIHLALFSGSTLYKVRADATGRHKLLTVDHAGLPVPSPDGKWIAYVTFAPRPRKQRPDLQFWGGSIIWVVSSEGGTPKQVTLPTDDETFDLRWLTDSSLIFDRIGEGLFNSHARIWTVPLGASENLLSH
jgi:hypothetical protein